MAEMWSGLVWAALRDLNTRLVAVLPSILAMLTLAAVGLVAAWVAALLLKRLARALAFDQRAETWGLVSPITRAGLRRSPSQLLAIMVFWAIFVLFLTLAVDALAIPGAGRVTDFVFAWVPRVLGEGALIAAVNAVVPQARLLARAVRWGVLLFASATAVTHLGIGKEMVLVAFGITFGGLILALALAFGLGGRALAREILERRLRQDPHPSETFTHL